MPLTREQLYKAHVNNLSAVETACDHVHRQLRTCIAADQALPANALLKTFMLLVGAWAEVRLLKLLHEPSGFSDTDRATVLAVPAKIDQWKSTVEIGVPRRYNIPTAALDVVSIGFTAFSLFSEINSIIDNELRPVIEVRNKLAHGQWARALNTELTEISQDITMRINAENALSMNFKKQMLEALSQLIHDLVASSIAFPRDVDLHYRTLHQARTNLRTRKYEDWAEAQREKLKRGRQRARAPAT